MNVFSTLSLRLTAARELGFTQTALFFFYQLGKKTGLWQRLTPARDWTAYQGELHTHEIIPAPEVPRAADSPPLPIPPAAEDVLNDRVTLFGARTVPLTLTVPGPLHHWTHHETAQIHGQDIKFIWEPARFGWVFPLAYAYTLTNDDRYPAAFWTHFETFCAANPPNLGPHWSSAQEVGLRLIAFVSAHRAFAEAPSSTPARLAALGAAVAAHAARIPPTLLYARAQNNNHLLSESAALYTAALTLPDHPQAAHWRALGWNWFHHGLQTQIEPNGTYSQHSTNYHRLMLQLALWVHALAQNAPQLFPALSLERLAAATRWLLALCDPTTGRVPNLGPNDGAYIFPHPTLPFHDYRPVLQAASRTFLGEEFSVVSNQWSVVSGQSSVVSGPPTVDSGQSSAVRRPPSADRRQSSTDRRPPTADRENLPTAHCLLTTPHSRALLRTAHFSRRPGHADQLHLDLWWRGLNVALDPGTYLYNAAPPWDNALMSAFVHNTLTINGLDQMTRAGRFLYVNRAQATILERTPTRLVAEHNGYRALGLCHRRTVEPLSNGWRVTDVLLPNSPFPLLSSPFSFRIHWLLPDWPWKLEGNALTVQSPFGDVRVKIVNSELSMINCQLFRAGETLVGNVPAHPTWGWFSPTYGVKEPALAFIGMGEGKVNGQVITEWEFPGEGLGDTH